MRCVDTVSIQYNEMQCNAIAPGVGGFSLCSSRCLRGRSFAALRSTSRATPSPSDRCPKLKLTLALTLNQARTTVIAMHSHSVRSGFEFSVAHRPLLHLARRIGPICAPPASSLQTSRWQVVNLLPFSTTGALPRDSHRRKPHTVDPVTLGLGWRSGF